MSRDLSRRLGHDIWNEATTVMPSQFASLRHRRSWQIGPVLLYLFLAVVLPAVGLGITAFGQAIHSSQYLAREQLNANAQALALAVDREIAGHTTALEVFAQDQRLGDRIANLDLAELDAKLRRLVGVLRTNVFIAGPGGEQILNTRVPLGSPLPRLNGVAMVDRVFATGTAAVSSMVTGSISGQIIVDAGVPVLRADGSVALVIGAGFPGAMLHDLLARSRLPQGWFAALIDPDGMIVAASDEVIVEVGKPTSLDNQRHYRAADHGTFRGVSHTGLPREYGFYGIPSAPGWRLTVGRPRMPLADIWQAPETWWTTGAVLALVFGLWFISVVTSRLLQPIRMLSLHARAVADGQDATGAGSLPPMRIAELEDLRQGMAAAEATLRANEQRSAELLATIDLGAFLTHDPDGIIRFWSKGCERMYGWTADEAVGQRAHDLLRSVFPEPLADIGQSLETSGIWEGTLRQHTRDGTEIEVECREIARHDATGRMTVLETLKDVTRQRQIERALVHADARFRTIINTMPTMAWEADASAALIWVSDSWGRYCGVATTEIRGDAWLALAHPDERADLEEHRANLIHEPKPFASWRRIRRASDGMWRWHLLQGEPQFAADGTLTGWVGAATDVHDLREAEAALAASESRLRLASSIGQFGVFDDDYKSGEIHWDQRMRTLWGFSPDEPISVPDILATIHPDDRKRHDAMRAAALDPAVHAPYECELRIINRSDGVERHIAAHGWVFFEHDVPVRLIGTALDITAQRKAEAVLARDRAELERLIEERTAALRDSEERLAQAAKMEALGRLAGGVAHDFNNVLQAVQNGVALARKRMAKDPASAERMLDLVLDASQRGAAVTGRLLSFARRGALKADTIEPEQLLDGILQILRPTLGPSVRLALGVPPNLPPIWADVGQLEAVLINLANNARDALPGGAGAITLSAESVTVRGTRRGVPSGLKKGDYVRLSVTDDGEGMTQEVLARAMEPFFTTKPKGQGTGLGLSMARGFAEQSKGGLSIQSAPGQGTTVSLWLPTAATIQAATANTETAPPVRLGRGRFSILLVDDEAPIRNVMAEAMSEGGHAVTVAKDAATALAALDSGVAADVLVTDLSMPGGMDGLGLIREARGRRPGLPAVLVTGHSGDAAREALRAAASDAPFAVLRKPVSVEAMEVQITSLLAAAAELRPMPADFAGGNAPVPGRVGFGSEADATSSWRAKQPV